MDEQFYRRRHEFLTHYIFNPSRVDLADVDKEILLGLNVWGDHCRLLIQKQALLERETFTIRGTTINTGCAQTTFYYAHGHQITMENP